jgi:hypothetical protein
VGVLTRSLPAPKGGSADRASIPVYAPVPKDRSYRLASTSGIGHVDPSINKKSLTQISSWWDRDRQTQMRNNTTVDKKQIMRISEIKHSMSTIPAYLSSTRERRYP